MDFRDRIFKGATRPAMMFGIPIVPFILIVGTNLLLIAWTFTLVSGFLALAIAMSLVVQIIVLRQINSNDNHKLSQYFLYFREFRHRKNQKHWKAHSISPVKLKKR